MRSGLRRGASLIRQHPWIPAVATLASALGLVVAFAIHLELFWLVAAAGALLFFAYAWGYSARALKHPLWPPLTELQRRSYAEVWDSIAVSQKAAAVSVSGHAEEVELQRSGEQTLRNLLDLASIATADEVLEIGCGVGRIGLALARHCRAWTGADISANMVAFAKDRLCSVENVRVAQLREVGLGEFSDACFDVVYVTNMFPHIDEIDRWRYVEEAFRVLRPGGRIFIDNVDIESDAGWAMFVNDAKRFRTLQRPPYIPRYSTAAELMAYATRAGFEHVESHHRSPLVIVTAERRR